MLQLEINDISSTWWSTRQTQRKEQKNVRQCCDQSVEGDLCCPRDRKVNRLLCFYMMYFLKLRALHNTCWPSYEGCCSRLCHRGAIRTIVENSLLSKNAWTCTQSRIWIHWSAFSPWLRLEITSLSARCLEELNDCIWPVDGGLTPTLDNIASTPTLNMVLMGKCLSSRLWSICLAHYQFKSQSNYLRINRSRGGDMQWCCNFSDYPFHSQQTIFPPHFSTKIEQAGGYQRLLIQTNWSVWLSSHRGCQSWWTMISVKGILEHRIPAHQRQKAAYSNHCNCVFQEGSTSQSIIELYLIVHALRQLGQKTAAESFLNWFFCRANEVHVVESTSVVLLLVGFQSSRLTAPHRGLSVKEEAAWQLLVLWSYLSFNFPPLSLCLKSLCRRYFGGKLASGRTSANETENADLCSDIKAATQRRIQISEPNDRFAHVFLTNVAPCRDITGTRWAVIICKIITQQTTAIHVMS